MKIALVCPYNMFEQSGGVHQLVTHLADGLRKKGHKVTIITSRPVRYYEPAPEGYLLLGKSRRMNTGFGTVGDVTFEIDNQEVKAAIEKEDFDVINFHEPWVPILARQILPYSKAAHVATMHANLTENLAAKSFVTVFTPYGRDIIEKMHILTAPSEAAASALISKEPQNPLVKNIRYVPNGIDLKLYKPLKKRIALNGPGTKTIVFIGRLEKRKGAEWLVKAFSELVKEMPNAHLMIAGKGSRLSKLHELVDDFKIPNVSFPGYIDDERKRHIMSNADLFCSPATFGESFGIVLLEAMGMGIPLVAGNNMGYKTILTNEGRLGLVDPEATSDFANRLFIFLSDEKIRRLYRDWELREVKKFNYPKVVDQYEAVYKDAINAMTDARSAKAAEDENGRKTRKTLRRFFVRRHTR